MMYRIGFLAAVWQAVIGPGIGGQAISVIAGFLHGGAQNFGRSFIGAIGYGEHLTGDIEYCTLDPIFEGQAFFNAGRAHVAHGRTLLLNCRL